MSLLIRTMVFLMLALLGFSKEITRGGGPYEISTSDEVSAGIGTTAQPKERNAHPIKDEKKIEAQLKAVNKSLKCKSRFEKVYTRELEQVKKHSKYSDEFTYDLFPEVLSVKKCDRNCAYCHSNGTKFGERERGDFSCKPTKEKSKKYTIRATNIDANEVEYFNIRLKNEVKCKCQTEESSTIKDR